MLKIILAFIPVACIMFFFGWCFTKPTRTNDLMFLVDDIPLYKSNAIVNHKGKKYTSTQIAKMFWTFEKLKIDYDDYIEKFLREYPLSESSIKLFDQNIIKLDDDYQIRAFYQKTSNDKIFIFIHGILMSIFRKSLIGEEDYSLRKYFQDDFDILIPELPGSSINVYKNDEENFLKMLDVCAAWIKKNYSGEKIVISGHSFGCWLALGLAHRLKSENVSVILNNCFYDSQSAIIWTLSPLSKKFIKKITAQVYSNDDLLKDLNSVKTIFILAQKKDFICPYDDAKKLGKKYKNVQLIDIFPDSRNYSYEYHHRINFEENFWIASNIENKNYSFTKDNYKIFYKKFFV